MLWKPLFIFYLVICCESFNTGRSTYRCWQVQVLSADSQLPPVPFPPHRPPHPSPRLPHPATTTCTRLATTASGTTCRLLSCSLPCCNFPYSLLLHPFLFFCLLFLLREIIGISNYRSCKLLPLSFWHSLASICGTDVAQLNLI